jgi:hypothetical protein
MGLKLLNLGLPKSGTTTLARALKLAGWKVADYRIRPRQTPEATLHGAYVADLLYDGYYQTGDPTALLPGFDAISESSLLQQHRSVWPQTDAALVRAIRARHLDVRLLATSRDPFEMSQSMLAWSDMGTERLPGKAVPGLPVGFGRTTAERVRWIEGHYATLRQLYGADPAFLDLDIAAPDARDRLSAFLRIDLPWWGKANRNPLRQAQGADP